MALPKELTSLTAVIDPMAEVPESLMREVFPDQCMPFKDHFVLDLDAPIDERITRHHKRMARRGQKRVRIEWADEALGWESTWGGDWQRLYGELVQRHAMLGPAAFDAESLQRQLTLPGMRVQRALVEDRVVSMALWAPRGGGVTYHLAATDAEGYEASAAYALLYEALHRFREEGLAWVHFGAAAGTQASASGGLNAFKSGWANRTLPAYLCGRILQPEAYARWCDLAQVPRDVAYFPAYRFHKSPE